jgi:hypothetical protein
MGERLDTVTVTDTELVAGRAKIEWWPGNEPGN